MPYFSTCHERDGHRQAYLFNSIVVVSMTTTVVVVVIPPPFSPPSFTLDCSLLIAFRFVVVFFRVVVRRGTGPYQSLEWTLSQYSKMIDFVRAQD